MNATTSAETGVRGVPAARPQSRLFSLAAMAITAIALIGVAYLSNQPAAPTGLTPVDLPGVATGPAPEIGKVAPAFAATMPDGSPVQLSDYAGKAVWLTFGASWCQPCRAENPDIAAAYEAFKDQGVVVVQVYMSEDAATVKSYGERVGIPYIQVPDPAYTISDAYRILGIPSHFFIDRTGTLREIKVGTLDPETMASLLTEIAG